MSYLQITTKCNMSCSHCCYSCGKNGKHGDYYTILRGIEFARDMGDESISIGGGEPTLHPRFFDILRKCMQNFDYVWMATNGSKTKSMYRLSSILNDCDYENFDCTCSEEDGYCQCYDNPEIIGNSENRLSVALSQDYFHDQIDSRIVDLWTKRANQHTNNRYEIRNVTNSYIGVIGQGRAKKNGYDGKHCVCPDIIIKPDGKIRLCGCTKSPVIGDVFYGIEKKWEDIIYNDDGYNNEKCYKGIGKKP
jgi:hypothetical protein